MSGLKTFYKQVYRYTRPRSMRHMENAWPYLKISLQEDDGKRVVWRGNHLFDSPAWPKLQSSYRQPQKALIVATGPSIKEENLSSINQAFVCGVNGAVALQRKYDVRFDAYFFVDPGFIKECFNLFREVIKQRIPCFLTYHCIRQACEIEPDLLVGADLILIETLNERFNTPKLKNRQFYDWVIRQDDVYASEEYTPANDKVGFSMNPALGLFDGATVVFWALQTLSYIGFPEIGILGMDLGNSGKQPRFYENQNNKLPTNLLSHYKSSIEPSFIEASRAAEENHFKLFNLSAISLLPAAIIPKISLTEYLTPQEQSRHKEYNVI